MSCCKQIRAVLYVRKPRRVHLKIFFKSGNIFQIQKYISNPEIYFIFQIQKYIFSIVRFSRNIFQIQKYISFFKSRNIFHFSNPEIYFIFQIQKYISNTEKVFPRPIHNDFQLRMVTLIWLVTGE